MPSIAIRQADGTQATGVTPTTTGVTEYPTNSSPGEVGLAAGVGIVCAIIIGTILAYHCLKYMMHCYQRPTRQRNRAWPRHYSQATRNRFTGHFGYDDEAPPPSYSTDNLLAGGTSTHPTRPGSFASTRSGGGDKIPPPPYTRVALPGSAVIANHTQTTSHHVSWTVVESIELTGNHTRTGVSNRAGAAGAQSTERQGLQAAASRRVWWELPALSIL